MKNLHRSLKPKGDLIIATFAEDGPLKCSGLEIERYSLEKLCETLGTQYRLVESMREEHQTPSNTKQRFLYAHFKLEKANS